jgi:predicted DNA-binding transcriptional regulator AlpA
VSVSSESTSPMRDLFDEPGSEVPGSFASDVKQGRAKSGTRRAPPVPTGPLKPSALDPVDERFLTDKAVGGRFEVSRQTVWRWVQQGIFPAPVVISPGTTRWRLSDLLSFEASRKHKNTNANTGASSRSGADRKARK